MATTTEELTGVRKAAVLLLTLDQDRAAEVLKRLSPTAVEEVSREIAQMRGINVEMRRKVFSEFYHLAMANHHLAEGGLEYAKTLLTRSLSEEDAKRIIKQVTQQVQTTPFSFLQKAESENLLTFIQDEHPQTIALILAHLNPAKASEILVGLPSGEADRGRQTHRQHGADEPRGDQGSRARPGASPQRHRQPDVRKGRRRRQRGRDAQPRRPQHREGIMEGLEAEDPDLVENIRRLMFVFDDVAEGERQGHPDACSRKTENDTLLSWP